MEISADQTRSQEKMQSGKTTDENLIGKKAVIGFFIGATIVFGMAITYCLSTDYKIVAAVLTCAFVLVCIYGASVYKSFK